MCDNQLLWEISDKLEEASAALAVGNSVAAEIFNTKMYIPKIISNENQLPPILDRLIFSKYAGLTDADNETVILEITVEIEEE